MKNYFAVIVIIVLAPYNLELSAYKNFIFFAIVNQNPKINSCKN